MLTQAFYEDFCHLFDIIHYSYRAVSIMECFSKLNPTGVIIVDKFRHFFAKVFNKILDPHMIPSYSQFGEDRVIEAFFHGQANGFYVDVGCNLPVSYSNTWKLYLKGWRGIGIDPNPSLINQFRKVRPRDTAIQKVVSNKRSLVDFYFSKDSHLTSGIGPKTSGHWKRTTSNSDIVQCQSETLSNIFKEYDVPHQFDLLSIDVEGNEIAVLDSIDLKLYSPRFIAIEMHDFSFSSPDDDPVYAKLRLHGYHMSSYLRSTGFFSRELQ